MKNLALLFVLISLICTTFADENQYRNPEMQKEAQNTLSQLFENADIVTQEKTYDPYLSFDALEISSGKIIGSSQNAHYAPNGFPRKYREFLEKNGTPKDTTQTLAFPFEKKSSTLDFLTKELGTQKVYDLINSQMLYLNAPRVYDCYKEDNISDCIAEEYYTPNLRKLETYFIESEENQTITLTWSPLNPYQYDSFDMELIGEGYPTPLTIADPSIDAHHVNIRVQHTPGEKANILFSNTEQKLLFTRLLPWNIPAEDLKRKPYLTTPSYPVYHIYPYYEAKIDVKKGINKITFEYFTTTDLLRPGINGADSYPIWRK